MAAPYPLLFRPVLLEKVWGGDRLRRFGKDVRPGATVGESWEVADMAATSASGAGGGAVRTVIVNGALAGQTLREAIGAWGHRLLGRAAPASSGGVGGFPLLFKFLDARENLSLQVHPSPAYAAKHRGAHLKTECWYILAAEPGAVIYKGIRAGVSAEELARRVREDTLVEVMETAPAVVGECHNLPSGTCHALGAGVVIAEVQTASDTTFRVSDWGRRGRELHVEEALACIDPFPAPRAQRVPLGQSAGRLVATEFFALDELRCGAGEGVAVGVDGRCVVLMVVGGSGRLHATNDAFEEVALPLGQSAVVPAAIAERTEFVADGPAVVLRTAVM